MPKEAPAASPTAPPPRVNLPPAASLDDRIAAAVQQSEARLEKMIQSLLAPLLQAQSPQLQIMHLPRNDPADEVVADGNTPKVRRRRESKDMQTEP